jgi:hypothetical protein
MSRYETVVFLQGDDYDEAMREVDQVTKDDESAHWRTAPAWDALYNYLMQWEYGEPTGHEYSVPPWGSNDHTDDSHEGYVVAWNDGLGYVSLNRVSSGEVANDEPADLS